MTADAVARRATRAVRRSLAARHIVGMLAKAVCALTNTPAGAAIANRSAAARLMFNSLSAFRGDDYGSTPKGPASFTFGLKPQEAMSYLKISPGRKLVETTDGLRLEWGSS
jgi:hypothetical protein